MPDKMLAVREANPGYNNKEYPGNLTTYVVITCIVAGMGGLIFGNDMGISGSVTLMDPFVKKYFPAVVRKKNDKSTNEYCQHVSQTMSMFTLSLYFSSLIGSVVASTVNRKFGLRFSMLFGGVFSCVGAIINGFANDIWMHIVGRMLLRFGIGFINQSVPLYLSEMAPYRFRGALNIGFQLSVTIGLLLANVLNYFANIRVGWGWILRLGGVVVPGFIFTVGSFLLPETSNSMIERGLRDEARDQLRIVRGVEDVNEEFNDLIRASEVLTLVEHPWTNLLQRKYRPQLIMAVLIPVFQQLTGINVIMFYATVLFNTIGFGSDASLMSAVITVGVNVVATLVSIYGVDKWGRRFLFLEGGVQMLISQCLLVAIGAKLTVQGELGLLPKWYAIVLVLVICIYVSGFAWSWGPLGWLVPSEIFPWEIRSAAQSVNFSVNMIFTYIVPEFFLTMLCHLKFRLFISFPFFMLVMSSFIFFFFPETKGVPIEEMTMVWKAHWYWSRFVTHNDHPGKDIEIGKIEEAKSV